MSKDLNQGKALIFRIAHRENVPWILDNGLHCRNSDAFDPDFVTIGNPELIDKRHNRDVPIPPGGSLSNYVPFYFTPYSPMMYNITTGYGGIRQRSKDEIVIFVSSLHTLREREVDFVYTDRHAYLRAAVFSFGLENLDRIDWEILQRRDFKHDDNDPGKVERYQAEALIHQHVPINVLHGLVCYDSRIKNDIEVLAAQRRVTLKVVAKPNWYV